MNEHEAGRELDVVVAERLMGWTLFPYMMPADIADLGNAIWCPPGPVHISTARKVPAYSTDIAAAWEVVEKMAERWDVEVYRIHNMPSVEGPTEWACKVGDLVSYAHGSCGVGETAPLAICRAALAATHPIPPSEVNAEKVEDSRD